MSATYTVDAFVHRDGVITVTCEFITGLVLEVNNLGELSRELHAIAPQLLQANHGLSEAKAKEAQYRVRWHDAEDATPMDKRITARASASQPMHMAYA